MLSPIVRIRIVEASGVEIVAAVSVSLSPVVPKSLSADSTSIIFFIFPSGSELVVISIELKPRVLPEVVRENPRMAFPVASLVNGAGAMPLVSCATVVAATTVIALLASEFPAVMLAVVNFMVEVPTDWKLNPDPVKSARPAIKFDG